MRICLVSFEYLPCTNYGGAAALYFDLANGLARLGHDVVVLSGNDRPGVEIIQDSGVTNVRFGAGHTTIGFIGRIWRSSLVLRRYQCAEREHGSFDVVESPEINYEPFLLNLLRDDTASVTRLISPTILLAMTSGKKPSLVQNMLERKNASLSSVLLADSPSWGMAILDEWGLKDRQFRECPIGIDLDRIDAVPLSHDSHVDPYVLFSGRLTIAKGPHILAAAAKDILEANPSMEIVFAGTDRRMPSGESMREHILRSVSDEVRRSITFKGRIESWNQLVNLYRGAAVCVKADVYGNHSFDAMGQMACSKPLVCTRTEGNADLIEDGLNGFLFDRESPDQLAMLVNRLMDDDKLRITMGRNARRTIESRFSSDIMASQTARIYEDMLT